MPAYVMFLREGPVRDEAAMAEYWRILTENEIDPKLETLALYGQQDVLEGRPPEGVVLLRFPTMADARAWYDGDAYRAAAPHRIKAADYRAVIFEGLEASL